MLDRLAGRIAIFDGDVTDTAVPLRSITSRGPQQTLSPVSLAVAGDDLVLADQRSRRIVSYAGTFGEPAPIPAAEISLSANDNPNAQALDPGPLVYDPSTDTFLDQHLFLIPRSRVGTRLTEFSRAGSVLRSFEMPPGTFPRDDDTRFGFAVDTPRSRILFANIWGAILSISRDMHDQRTVVPELRFDGSPSYAPRAPFAAGATRLVALEREDYALEIRDLATAGLLHRITGIDNRAFGMALDELHGEIFLASQYGILVYPLDGDGPVGPLRSLITDFQLTAIAYDPARERLIVATGGGEVLAYSRTAAGRPPNPAIPLATFIATRTRLWLENASDLAAEPGRIWTVDPGGWLVSLASGNGLQMPIETRDLSALGPVGQIALGPAELFVSQWILPRSGGPAQCTFPSPLLRAVSNGEDALLLSRDPDFHENLLTITRGAASDCPYQSVVRTLRNVGSLSRDLAVDAAHGEIFVLAFFVDTEPYPSIVTYPLRAEGDAVAVRRLNLRAHFGTRILYDASRDRIDVLSGTDIASWPRTASETDPPVGVLGYDAAALKSAAAFALCE